MYLIYDFYMIGYCLVPDLLRWHSTVERLIRPLVVIDVEGVELRILHSMSETLLNGIKLVIETHRSPHREI